MNKMHVTYINRDKRTGNFSFERIFRAVQKQLAGDMDIENYYLPSVRARVRGIREVSRLKADVFHITGDVNYLAFGLPGNKLVITVHDLGFFENPVNKGVKRFIYKYIWLKYPLRRAAAITTVSEFTKSKLMEYFQIREDKITVIPNPVFKEMGKKKGGFNESKPTILQIGTGPHKNLEGLIRAVKNMNVRLSIVGKPGEDERLLMKKYGIDHEIAFNIGDEALKKKYEETDILFFASFHEGFGVPVIEANQLGIPVITSNLGPMPWVAGDAAILVDPENHEEISMAIKKIIKDKKKRENMVEKGFENIKRFDPEIISEQYLEVYRKVHNANIS